MKINQFEPLGCPRCSGLFKQVMRKIRHPSGAVLDVCDRCHGLWADKGELRVLFHHAIRTEEAILDKKPKSRAKGKAKKS